ncbi:MAG: type II toxin-antitoxin system VapC family toxin [Devosia sp.]
MRSNFLLDTCAIIWVSQGIALAAEAMKALDQAEERAQPTFISQISAWELGILVSRGRVPSAMPVSKWFDSFLERSGFALQALTSATLADSSFLPGLPPRDPADRIIITTARAFDLTVVTRDRAILEYAKQGYVRALPC